MPFSGFQDLDPAFAASLQQLIAANNGITPFSGFRSIERQRQLWEASDKSGRMVARPGRSQHNFGRAVDLRYADDAARQFAHANAAKYGLSFPMSYEPWHVEPIGARSGRRASAPQDRGSDTPQTDILTPPPINKGNPLGAMAFVPGFGDLTGSTQTQPGYQRPLPFEAGFGGQQFLQGLIGGTLKQDMRAAMFKRIGALFA